MRAAEDHAPVGLGWVGLGGTMAHYCITACSEECSFFFFTLLWHLLFSAPLMNSKNVWNRVSVRPLETITLPTQKISLESFCHGKHLISNHILAQQQVGGWGLNVWICIIIWLEYITGFQLIREGQSFWCACLHSHLSPPAHHCCSYCPSVVVMPAEGWWEARAKLEGVAHVVLAQF